MADAAILIGAILAAGLIFAGIPMLLVWCVARGRAREEAGSMRLIDTVPWRAMGLASKVIRAGIYLVGFLGFLPWSVLLFIIWESPWERRKREREEGSSCSP